MLKEKMKLMGGFLVKNSKMVFPIVLVLAVAVTVLFALNAKDNKRQEELAKENKDIIMVSRQFKSFAARGLMKDQFHYLQPGYNLVGDEAGAMVGEYLLRHSH